MIMWRFKTLRFSSAVWGQKTNQLLSDRIRTETGSYWDSEDKALQLQDLLMLSTACPGPVSGPRTPQDLVVVVVGLQPVSVCTNEKVVNWWSVCLWGSEFTVGSGPGCVFGMCACVFSCIQTFQFPEIFWRVCTWECKARVSCSWQFPELFLSAP